MAEIDQVINQHGGWPGAFALADTVTLPAELDSQAVPVLTQACALTESPRDSAPDLFGAPTDKQDHSRRVDLDDKDALCAEVRHYFGDGQLRERQVAIAELSTALGFTTTSTKVDEALDNALRTAVRRGILNSRKDGHSLRYKNIEQYETDDRDGLKVQFLAAIPRSWIERDDAVTALARWLGFRRTGAKIQEIVASLINGLLREGRIEKDGSQIRRST